MSQSLFKGAHSAMTKIPRQLPTGKLLPLPIPQRPWSHIGVDFVTDLPASDGNTCILVAIDRFSKACKLIPLKVLPTAFETAELPFNHVFCNFGIPEDIVCDRRPQFILRVLMSFLAMLSVTVSLVTLVTILRQSGKQNARSRMSSRFLRTFCHRNQNIWNRYLVWAEYAQNSLRKTSNNLTPFQCILKETPVYQPGQLVWLPTPDIRLRQPCKKLSQRYRIQPTFHISLLKPHHLPVSVPSADPVPDDEPPLPPIDAQPIYTVKEPRQYILDPSLPTEFQAQHPEKPAPRTRGRPPRCQRVRPAGADPGGG